MTGIPFFKFRRGPAVGKAAARQPLRVVLQPRVGASPEQAAARKAAASMPGFRPASRMLGEALAAGATAVLLEISGSQVTRRWRVDNAWQDAEPLAGDAGATIVAALKKLAVVAPGAAAGIVEGEFLVAVRGARRPCRVAVRGVQKREQMLVGVGGELPAPARQASGGVLARWMPLRWKKAADDGGRNPLVPAVMFEVARGVDPDVGRRCLEEARAAAAYQPACELVGAAIAGRAGEILIESNETRVSVHHDVDGVRRPMATLERPAGEAIMAVLKRVATLDPKESRRRQIGRCMTAVEGKPWPCTIEAQGLAKGERVLVSLDYGRPKFKTLADLGVPDELVGRIKDLVSLESGVIVVAGPPRGGLSTLFEGIVASADRLLRDFVVLEDAANPRPEIQNVKPVRWNATAGVSPADAVVAALREYPRVLVTGDLEDQGLALKLVEQAEQGLLVIVGIRGADAADGIARLLALGVDPAVLGRLLRGAVGTRLLRKLCPKCREEYLPAAAEAAAVKLPPESHATLYRPASAPCGICAGTGYLGRTAVFELAAGPTLNRYLAKSADAAVLRQAAAKDGMVPVHREARQRVIDGITSLQEFDRVFGKK